MLRRAVVATCFAVAVLLALAGNALADCTDPYEPNQTFAQAWGPLVNGTHYTAYICYSGDDDWYKFVANGPGTVHLFLANPGAVDYEMQIYDASQNLLVYNWVGYARNTDMAYTVTAPGTYYVHVFGINNGADHDATNPYYLDYTFSTGQSPVVWTAPASARNGTDVAFYAQVTTQGFTTTGWFRWGTDPTLATYNTTSVQGLGFANVVGLNQIVVGLLPKTTYYFRPYAQSSAGLSYGALLSYATPDVPVATVVTLPASNITTNSADLNGTVTPPSQSSVGTWFEYSLDPAMQSWMVAANGPTVQAGAPATDVSFSVTGLAPNTTYYYRAVAAGLGSARGGVVMFRTGPGTESRHRVRTK